MFVRCNLSKLSLCIFSKRHFADKIIKTPYMADSITQGTLASWEKKIGQFVKQDELIANIETDKVTIPINCPESGLLKKLFAQEGDTVEVGSDLFEIDVDAKESEESINKNLVKPEKPFKSEKKNDIKNESEKGLGIISKLFEAPVNVKSEINSVARTQNASFYSNDLIFNSRRERREKMSRMRLRIAERMKEAQNTSASLTTFNEVDMSALKGLRTEFKDQFLKEHGVKLGYMSAFVKACAKALKEIPGVNSRMDVVNQEIVYSDFVDISVAVATEKGLVTPVIRNCEGKGFAEIEKEIADFGGKARDGKIALEDLAGGTFTISNGGVFGSLMGTPILNFPQSAILGMHAIKERPIVMENGEIKARPMMYLALTYDHRLIDGREAVSFLVRVKELLENPARFIFDL